MPQFHELADAFPLITGEAFDELKKDIQENGQLEPVVMYEGKILDGRNRWRAMQELDLPHKEIKLPKETDPIAYVWSKNAVRRQLTPAQKALAATRLVTAKSGDNQHTRNGATTVGQAAEMAGVSDRSIQRARKVLEQGAPEVVAAVQSGELGIVPAEALAEKPKEIQAEIMKQGPKEAAKAVSAESTRKKGDDAAVAKSDGPGRGHVGPEVTMTRQMEASSAEGSKARTKFWAENKELIAKLSPELLKRYVADLSAERRAIEQLLRLIKAETEAAVTPRSNGSDKGADVPTEPVKVAAKKATPAAKKAAPAKTAAATPAAKKAVPAKKTAARKPVTSLTGEPETAPKA
jgi:ParB-like chromosome segregation protein Spo0J